MTMGASYTARSDWTRCGTSSRHARRSWKSFVRSCPLTTLRSMLPSSSGSNSSAPGTFATSARATVVLPTPNGPLSQMSIARILSALPSATDVWAQVVQQLDADLSQREAGVLTVVPAPYWPLSTHASADAAAMHRPCRAQFGPDREMILHRPSDPLMTLSRNSD